MRRNAILCSVIAVGMSGALSAPAMADAYSAEALKEQPAVRHRLLLVKNRFEVTPTFEATINADFKQTLSAGLKVEYHLSDMLSVGVAGLYGKSINTGLTNSILDTLPDTPPDGDPAPSRDQFEQHLNTMPLHGAAYVSVTPWYGKLAAFGRAFVNFDFYFSGGLAFAQLQNACAASVCSDDAPGEGITMTDPDTGEDIIIPDNNPNDDPPSNDGLKGGLYMGGGIHVFATNWLALDLSVRDYWFTDNPSGLDFNYDQAVKNNDRRSLHHLFVGIGVSILLPLRAERTP